MKILPAESLIDALRRTLGREPDYEDVIKSCGGRFVGESEVRPHDCGGEIYDQNNSGCEAEIAVFPVAPDLSICKGLSKADAEMTIAGENPAAPTNFNIL